MLGSETWRRITLTAALALGLACSGEEPAAPASDPGETPPAATRAAPPPAPAPAPARQAAATDDAADTVTAMNRPPVLLGVEIDDRGDARSDRDLSARPRAEDPDGDPLTFEYRWSLNDRPLDDSGELLPHSRFERGDRIGLSVRAADGESSSDWWRVESFEIGNSEPRITSIPGDFDPDGTFRYPIVVEDADGDRGHRYQILDGPTGMRIDRVSGTVIWTPMPDQGGVHPVKISVQDRYDGVATQDFDVRVGFEEFSVPAAPQP
jgi:hypothetical protein